MVAGSLTAAVVMCGAIVVCHVLWSRKHHGRWWV